jgi:dihydroorotate dehydrogenase (NAD+) catalytic subunit
MERDVGPLPIADLLRKLLIPITYAQKMSLAAMIGKMELENPLILASGILGETGQSLLKVLEAGAGAVVTKSIGLEPRDGYPNPTVVELEYGMLNAMGLPNPGIDEYREEVRTALKADKPVIGSIFGKNDEEFSALAKKMESFGASALELNLSCPHAKGYGVEIGSDEGEVKRVVNAVKSQAGIPVFAKLSPNVTDIGAIARAVQDGGGDGIVAINTIKAMAIEPELKRPVLSNRFGGLSGKAVKPVGLRCVYEIFEHVDIPVIGCGGVESGRDAVEYIMAGAGAVQIGSAIRSRGLNVFREVNNGISEFMNKNGFSNIGEMVGIAHKA